MASKRYAFEPDYAVPPGNTLIELLDSLGINQAELARRTDRPKKTISGIVRGNVSITADTALQFEKVLGMPASFWLNLEYNYQESLARIKEKEELAGALEWVKQIPVKEMQRYGWIKETNKPIELAQELLSFFGVANVAAWKTSGAVQKQRTGNPCIFFESRVSCCLATKRRIRCSENQN